MSIDLKCAQCGAPIPESPEGTITTGYGYERMADGTDRIICYPCCGKMDEEWMCTHVDICLYWDGKKITNWPGSLVIKPTTVRYTRHGLTNVYGRVTYVWFTFGGHMWMGRNMGDSQVLHCHRLKDAPEPRLLHCARMIWTNWNSDGPALLYAQRVLQEILGRREPVYTLVSGDATYLFINTRISRDRFRYIRGYLDAAVWKRDRTDYVR